VTREYTDLDTVVISGVRIGATRSVRKHRLFYNPSIMRENIILSWYMVRVTMFTFISRPAGDDLESYSFKRKC